MKKKSVRLLGYGLLVITLILCTKPDKAKANIPEFVLTYAENQSEDYPTTLGAYKFAELVEQASGGRIKIVVQPNGILGDEKSVMKQVKFGGVDFARVSLAEIAEVAPKYNVLQMPYLYRDSTHMWQVLDGHIGEDFLKEAKTYDLMGLSWYDAGARNFYNTVKPIQCLEDIQGMRIRVQESELMTDVIEALGARAIQMSYESIYSSLEQGQIDGAENNWPSYKAMHHDEVAKYYTIDEHTRMPEMQICSMVTWNKLLAEDQEMIKRCAQESALYERRLWQEQEKQYQYQEETAQQDIQITILTSKEKERFQNQVVSVYEKYSGVYQGLIEEIIKIGEDTQ